MLDSTKTYDSAKCLLPSMQFWVLILYSLVAALQVSCWMRASGLEEVS